MKTLMLFLALAPFANAAVPPGVTTQPLFTMTNDRDSNVDKLTFMVDDKGQAAGFFVVADPKNTDRQTDTFWLKDVEKSDGVVFVEGQGHKVIIMQGQLDRTTQEGRIHMQYLSNGLTNTYSTCDFLIKKNGSTFFAQNAYNGQKITNMKIITWSLGLKSLQGICQ